MHNHGDKTMNATDKNTIMKYRDLIIRRDSLKKECSRLCREYVRVFGALLEKLLNVKIDCIALKKKIAYCQRKLYCNEEIIASELDLAVTQELSSYYDELELIIKTKDSHGIPVPEIDVLRLKKLYRKIATILHPDLRPDLFAKKEIRELWERAKEAYISNDLPAMQEVDILLAGLIAEFPKTPDFSAEEIEEKIISLQEEMRQILKSDIYQYKLLLYDKVFRAEETKRLTNEIDEYKNYKEILRQQFAVFTVTEVYN